MVYPLFKSWNPVPVRYMGAEHLGQEVTSLISQAQDGRMLKTAPACNGKAVSLESTAYPVAVLPTDPAGRGLKSCPHTLLAFHP